MSIYTPYTYLIGWSKLNVWYYGLRFAKGCHPNDLWISYFTSSKKVEEYRKIYGEPDIIEIRKTFPNDPDKARLWEHKVLRRMEVVYREDFLNLFDGISIPSMSGSLHPLFGKSPSEERRKQISQTLIKRYEIEIHPNRGRKRPDVAERNKTLKFFKDKKHTIETRQIMSNKKKGKTFTKEHIENRNKTRIGRKCYNNGITEGFYYPDKQPDGFVLGRMK